MKIKLLYFILNTSLVFSFIFIVVPLIVVIPSLLDSDNIISYSMPETKWIPSFLLTLLYGLITTLCQAIIGIFLASVFYFITWGKRWAVIFGISILMLPYAIPSSITIMLFDFMFAENGYITNLLNIMGFAYGSILDYPIGRFFVMTIVSIWQYTPFFFIAVLVGLLAVPNSIVAQARIDGASPKQVLLYILLPVAGPAIYAAIILRLILMLGKVDISLAYYQSSIVGGAGTLPVQIINSIYNYSNMIPMGMIILLASILLIPIFIYYFLIVRK